MARVLIARTDATELSDRTAIPLDMVLHTTTFAYSQPLRIYTQFPKTDFDLEFMLVTDPPEATDVYATLEWYLEFFDDSKMLNDSRAPGQRYPTERLFPTQGELVSNLQAVRSRMGWVEDTKEVDSQVRGSTDHITNLRTVRIGSYSPVIAKCGARHLWTRVRFRLQEAYSGSSTPILYIYGNLGGFAEEALLDRLASPYAYQLADV